MKHEGRASGAGEGEGKGGMQSGAKLRWQKKFGSAAKGEREGERGGTVWVPAVKDVRKPFENFHPLLFAHICD